MTSPLSLDWLLSPLSLQQFRQQYLEQQMLLLSDRRLDQYQPLFDLAELDELLWSQPASTLKDSITLLRDGERIFSPQSPDIDLRRFIDSHYDSGATLLLEGLGRHCRRIALLQRELERALLGHVGVNLYVTPPESQGFEPHFDSHDVFVLQIAGTKRWKLYDDSFVKLPTRGQDRAVDAALLGAPSHELELRPGDLLYLPRGMVHEARAAEASSVHLTIGVDLVTWSDVLGECLRLAAGATESLRRSSATRPQPPADLAPLVASLRALLGGDDGDPIERATASLHERFVTSLAPLPRPRIGVLDEVGLIERPDDWVQRVDGMIGYVSTTASTARLASPGGEPLVEPREHEAALRWIAQSTAPFRICDIPWPAGVELKIELVQRLIARGFIRAVRTLRLLQPVAAED